MGRWIPAFAGMTGFQATSTSELFLPQNNKCEYSSENRCKLLREMEVDADIYSGLRLRVHPWQRLPTQHGADESVSVDLLIMNTDTKNAVCRAFSAGRPILDAGGTAVCWRVGSVQRSAAIFAVFVCKARPFHRRIRQFAARMQCHLVPLQCHWAIGDARARAGVQHGGGESG